MNAAIARLVALATPVELDEAIGIESLALMDNYFFKETALPEDRRAAIHAMFQDVVDAVGDEHRFQLEFRNGESLGANAFALPSGIVVLTDKLVELAQEDDEISAVLAHEVGHATNRHALRGLIQNSVAAAVVIVITGDVGSATNLAAGIPTLLVQTGYSRDFEREADEVAFVYMAEKGIDGRQLAELLQRIDQFYGREAGATSLLSTHPSTRERLETGAARAPGD